MKKCPFCAEDIQDAAIVCRFCQRPLTADAAALASPAAIQRQPWSPGVAAVLSFFVPGLGQIYKGHIARGLLFLVVTLAGYFMLVLPGVLIHIFVIVDAYHGSATVRSTIVRPVPIEAAAVEETKPPVELTPEERALQKANNRKGILQMLAIATVLAVVAIGFGRLLPIGTTVQRSTDVLVEKNDAEEWENKLKAIVTAAGQPCVSTVATFHQGTDARGNFWNLRCTDSTYSIQLIPGQSPKVWPCDKVQDAGGPACFTALTKSEGR